MAWLTVDLNHHGFGCLFFWQCSTATGGPFKEGYDGFFFHTVEENVDLATWKPQLPAMECFRVPENLKGRIEHGSNGQMVVLHTCFYLSSFQLAHGKPRKPWHKL